MAVNDSRRVLRGRRRNRRGEVHNGRGEIIRGLVKVAEIIELIIMDTSCDTRSWWKSTTKTGYHWSAMWTNVGGS